MKTTSFFNKNLIRAAAVILAAVFSTVCPAGICADTARIMSAPEEAEEFAERLLGDDPASLEGMYKLTSDMEKAVTSSGGWEGLAKPLALLGKAEKIGPAYAAVFKGRDVFRVPCSFSVFPVDLVFVLEDGMIAGMITDQYTGTKEAAEDEAEENHYTEEDLSIPVPALNGELPGTLTIPDGEGPFPVVILVHGSGPNNRNEEVMNVKPFQDLAYGLAEKGIAVYRYDKRTYVYGTEMASDFNVTLMEETVEDAAAAVQIVSQQDKIDSQRVCVLGHSLGAAAIPAISRQLQGETVKAAGFILMAPPARPLDELMKEQYEFLFSLMPEISEEQQEEKEKLFSELDRLDSLEDLPEDEQIAGAFVPYWKWLRSYDALKEAGMIDAPCLLLQGEEDYQVTMQDFDLWKEAIGNRPNWKMISYPGLVHVFVSGTKSEGTSVYLKDEHVDSQVISDIAAFVKDIS